MLMNVVTAAVALLGLALTAWSLGVARRTRSDAEDIAKKLDAVTAQLARFAKASGAALLLVAVALWLSRCEPSVTVVGGAGQSADVSQPLPAPVEVLVRTAFGPAEGATVAFAPMGNHGTAAPDVAVADSAGRAQTVWTLGSEAGEQRMVAQVVGGGSVWITAEAMPREEPVATEIKITPESAVLRFAGDIAPFSAEILDQYGDPFPGSVTWSSKRECVFRAGSYGFATALNMSDTDSIVATFDSLRATAPVRVRLGAR